ncbi:MAG: hypothetical protein QOF58_5647 [Pseudonocardiales bacterium]|nr:hypothetical protein [Pseudonocardiales bacterium]
MGISEQGIRDGEAYLADRGMHDLIPMFRRTMMRELALARLKPFIVVADVVLRLCTVAALAWLVAQLLG